MSANAKRREHVFLASLLWTDLWIVQQPMCREIGQEEPVLFVERFVSIATVLRYPKLWRRLFVWLKGVRSVGDGVSALAPLPLFHLGHRFPWLFRMEYHLQALWLRWHMRRWSSGLPRVLWIDSPIYSRAIGTVGEGVSIYYVADEFAAFPTSHRKSAEMLEREVLERVDLVFVASERLRNDKASLHPRVTTILNAIDAKAYVGLPQSPTPDLEGVAAPRVLLVGVIDAWVDVEFLAKVTELVSEVQFVIVGPVRTPVEGLRRRPNVHWFGRRERGTVPRLLASGSASLVPFRRSPLTSRTLPLKVFEALAAGVRPICTDFSDDLHQLHQDGHVEIASTPESFAAAVRKAVREDDERVRTQLSAFGRAQTWAARWQQARKVIGTMGDA